MNKKFTIAGLFVVLLMAISVFAAGVTAPTIYAPLWWSEDYGWNVATEHAPQSSSSLGKITSGEDSLVGVDTIVLLNKFLLKPGAQYAFDIKDTTGAADSIKFEADVYGFDFKTIMQTLTIDTIGGSTTYKAISIPVGLTSYGSAITLRAIKWISAKTAKIWRFQLFRLQPFDYPRQ